MSHNNNNDNNNFYNNNKHDMRMNEQVEMHSQLYIIHNNSIEIHYERKKNNF